MVLKAYIEEVPKTNENLYSVRIPYMEDTTNMKAIFDATLCNEPGVYSGYKVGDCVYVSFEGDKYSTPNFPVIMGKLYVSPTDEVDTSIIVNNLKVKNSIELPEDTKIGGYGTTEFFKLAQTLANPISTSDITYTVKGEIIA